MRSQICGWRVASVAPSYESSLFSTGYGEPTPADMLRIFGCINNLCPLESNDRFVDLGSGSGRMVLAAALLFGHIPNIKFLGLEIVTARVSVANAYNKQFTDAQFLHCQTVT